MIRQGVIRLLALLAAELKVIAVIIKATCRAGVALIRPERALIPPECARVERVRIEPARSDVAGGGGHGHGCSCTQAVALTTLRCRCAADPPRRH